MMAKRRWLLVFLVVVLAVAIGAAVVINVYRDSVALKVANRFLADSGATVSDVSVDSIGTDAVSFGMILIELADGASLEVRGVTLPVRFRGFRDLQLHVESLALLPAPEPTTGRPELAAGLRGFLEAGLAMHGAGIEIDTVSLPATPLLSDVAWYGDTLNPSLSATLAGLDVFVTSTPGPEGGYRVTLRVLTPADQETALLTVDVVPGSGGIAVAGKARVDLAPLVPLIRFFGALPDDVSGLDGTFEGPVEAWIATDTDEPVSVTLEPRLDSALSVDMAPAGAESYRILAAGDHRLSASFEYPALSWQAGVDALALEITGGGLENQRVDLGVTHCESGIRCRSKLKTTLESIEIGGLSVVAATLVANDVVVESADGRWTADADSVQLLLDSPAYAGRPFITPVIEGDFQASNEQLSTRLSIVTPGGGLTGRAEVHHELGPGRGELRFEDVLLDMDILPFSEVFATWEYEWDVSSGTWEIEGGVAWQQTSSGFAYRGRSLHTVSSLSGRYGDMGFLGFGTRAELMLDSASPPVVTPGSFELDMVDIGFPIEDITGTYTLDLAARALELADVKMTALGGSVTLAPLRYDIGADSNDILLEIESVQLPLMVGLANLDTVDITGSVSGGIPISVRGGSIVVEEGFLEADAPGGAIRYRSGGTIADEQTQLGIVTRTLENFQFEELTSEVHYSEQGDLKLQMRLAGTNPDVDPDQPVILNLGVENNIPQMCAASRRRAPSRSCSKGNSPNEAFGDGWLELSSRQVLRR